MEHLLRPKLQIICILRALNALTRESKYVNNVAISYSIMEVVWDIKVSQITQVSASKPPLVKDQGYFFLSINSNLS